MNFDLKCIILCALSGMVAVLIALACASRSKRIFNRISGGGRIPIKERFIFFLCSMEFIYFAIFFAILNPMELPWGLNFVASLSFGVLLTLLFCAFLGLILLFISLFIILKRGYYKIKNIDRRVAYKGLQIYCSIAAVLMMSLCVFLISDSWGLALIPLLAFLVVWHLSFFGRKIVSGWKDIYLSYCFILFIHRLSSKKRITIGKRSDL